MSEEDGLDGMRERYARRAALPAGRYAALNPEVQARVQERQRATTAVLGRAGISAVEGLDIVEVGCGSGGNLLEWLQLGADPQRLVGNELLPERLDAARARLPAAVRLMAGDAALLPFGEASFDVVHQSTVFSSILDDAAQARLAAAMWRWVRPGGGVLWYDFVVDNPNNPDVRGVPVQRLRALFPQGRPYLRRVTLAPPLARRVVPLHPGLYTVFNLIPWLRTHVLAWIAKP